VSETRDRLAAALAAYDPAVDADHLTLAEEEREQILERFPREAWPALALTDYAIGQEDSSETFCRWIEFVAGHLGSIRGGSSGKLIIYKRKSGPGWHYDEAAYDSVESAWEAVRGQFVAAMDAADSGDWPAIEELEALKSGQALLVKTLHLYFPDRVLPIASRAHLRHYLGLIDHPEAQDTALTAVTLNRALLLGLRELDARDLTTNQLERFLYRHFAPETSARWVKISPGHRAEYWPECLAGNFVAVGWEQMGDLREFASKDEYRLAFAAAYGERYNNQPHVVAKKANELWTLMELRPGDRVVANQGKSKILAVGTVREPGYDYDPSREHYRNLVRVDWDETYAKEIPQQGGWLNTIDRVTAAQRKLIEGDGLVTPEVEDAVELDPLYQRVAEALETKRQAILYGPPGTGKTFHARRFAAWWLRKQAGDANPESVLASNETIAAVEREFSGVGLARNAWLMVANPAQWSWSRLFVDGSVDYDYRRLRRNFPKVQVGDIVFGYESGSTNRLVALARISRAFGVKQGDSEPTITLEPFRQFDGGPSYQDLASDPVLAQSEPMRNGLRGSLFALTGVETDRLLARLPDGVDDLDTDADVGSWSFTTFHASYSYEDFVEGYRPVGDAGGALVLRLEDGIFKRVCLAARVDPARPYLLIIDEINRANVAKVFGELITLLEVDKRGLPATLPQSKERFVVPDNVYLLGTMNTADRSITLLDVALRRRFAFIELMPEPERVEQAVGPLKLAEFLAGLNRQVAKIAGREKQVGHAYLMPGGVTIAEPAAFARVFRLEILPLLQEYCYEEYGQLAEILGEGIVDVDGQAIKQDLLDDPEELVQALAKRFAASAADADDAA
jgi:5-methylcytosine-specific restriction protein B